MVAARSSLPLAASIYTAGAGQGRQAAAGTDAATAARSLPGGPGDGDGAWRQGCSSRKGSGQGCDGMGHLLARGPWGGTAHVGSPSLSQHPTVMG